MMMPRTIQCNTCGKICAPQGITMHQRKLGHVGQTIVAPELPEAPRPVRIIPTNGVTYQKMDNFIILEDSNGGVWLAERIR